MEHAQRANQHLPLPALVPITSMHNAPIKAIAARMTRSTLVGKNQNQIFFTRPKTRRAQEAVHAQDMCVQL